MEDTLRYKARSLMAVADESLLVALVALVQQSRRVEAELVAHLAEADARRLYAREGFPSMFAYCTDALHLSEAEAYLRITVARASRENAVLLTMLADGSLHLSGIARLAPHLTLANREQLLRQATHKTKRQILELIADLAPRPDAAVIMRKLPDRQATALAARQLCPDAVQPRATESARHEPGVGSVDTGSLSEAGLTAGVELCPDRVTHCSDPVNPRLAPCVIEPLGGARYRVQFTANGTLRDKLERLRVLMRSEVPDGDLATILERAVTDKIDQIERRRHAATDRPRKSPARAAAIPSSRHIPAAVRRAVHERDGNRCGFVSASGHRCAERDALEYHHRHPFGMGGRHDPANVALVCRTHNAWLAEQDYGRGSIRRARDRRQSAPH